MEYGRSVEDVHAQREKKKRDASKREESKKEDKTERSERRDKSERKHHDIKKMSRTQYKSRNCQVNLLMLQLWDTHVSLTREVVLAAVINTSNKDSSILALFDNQVQLGNNLTLYYGKKVGKEYTELLNEHIRIAIQIVVTVLGGLDPANLIKDWYINGNAIASFLAGINPHISKRTMKDLIDAHLECTLAEATLIIQNKYTDSILEYQTCLQRVKAMSEYISDAIVKAKFK